ncbi:hypothetical protein [Nitrogeniibacter aestuarii]|nr:hypothetical protein [Nitrogeniibacter aestuarii]
MASLKRGKRTDLGSEKGKLPIKYGKKRARASGMLIAPGEVLK